MLIIFEGVNGVGKTTLVKKLSERFNCFHVTTNSEPYNSELCKSTFINKIRQFISKPLRQDKTKSSKFKEFLFKFDRWLSNLQVKRYLDKGYIVFQDRSYISGQIYASLCGQNSRIRKPKFYDKYKVLYIFLVPSGHGWKDKIIKRIEQRDKKKLSKEEIDFLDKLALAYEEYGMGLILVNQEYIYFINPFMLSDNALICSIEDYIFKFNFNRSSE